MLRLLGVRITCFWRSQIRQTAAVLDSGRVKDLEAALHSLGPLEGRLMLALWHGELPEPFTVAQVRDRLLPELAYTTVMTTLSRLARKGLLTVAERPGNRATHYSVGATPSGYLVELSRRQAKLLREQYGHRALAAFAAELDELSPDDLRRLQRLAE